MSGDVYQLVKRLRLAVVLALFMLAVFSLWAAHLAHATTISVTTTEDELDNNGMCSLREAIRAINLNVVVDTCDPSGDADTILLPADTYLLSLAGSGENSAASGDLDITSALTITGALSSTVVIDGGQLDRVFDIFGGAHVTLVGLTIQHGDSGLSGHGGAVRNAGNLNVQSSAVISSTAAEFAGGGIASNGTLTLMNSTIAGNSARMGGGVENAGTLTIDHTIIENNAGGGISSAGVVTMTQSLIRENTSDSSGGGIASLSGTLAISNSIIISNTSELGGGIRNSGKLTLADSLIAGNSGEIGGGLANDSADPANVTNSTLSNNIGSGVNNVGALNLVDSTIDTNTGSGIFNDVRGTMAITQTTIAHNADGGINNRGTLSLANSALITNTASIDGGGIANTGTLDATNSTFSGNTALGNGGGVATTGPALVLNNVTITNNTADSAGDGLANGGGIYQAGDGTLALANTLVAGNIDNSAGEQATVHPDCSGTFESLGYNLIGDSAGGACINLVNGISGDLVGDRTTGALIDPKLGPLQDNDGGAWIHALQPDSPAIEAGNPAAPGAEPNACNATDQRGIERPQGARCDIGAYERVALADNPLPSITTISPAKVKAGDPSFTLTITGTNFVPGSAIYWNGIARPTQLISDTQLTAAISADDISVAGSVSVTVFNPPPGGGASNGATLVILQPDEAPNKSVVYLPLILNGKSTPALIVCNWCGGL